MFKIPAVFSRIRRIWLRSTDSSQRMLNYYGQRRNLVSNITEEFVRSTPSKLPISSNR